MEFYREGRGKSSLEAKVTDVSNLILQPDINKLHGALCVVSSLRNIKRETTRISFYP